jgi:hypothetical protein
VLFDHQETWWPRSTGTCYYQAQGCSISRSFVPTSKSGAIGSTLSLRHPCHGPWLSLISVWLHLEMKTLKTVDNDIIYSETIADIYIIHRYS